MKHEHTIKDLQVSVEAMEYSWECVLKALYSNTNRDIGLAEVVQDILALKRGCRPRACFKGKTMNIYNVEVDVQTTYRTEIEASNKSQAKEIALKEASEDTWGCRATFAGAEIYQIEEIGHEGEPI